MSIQLVMVMTKLLIIITYYLMAQLVIVEGLEEAFWSQFFFFKFKIKP